MKSECDEADVVQPFNFVKILKITFLRAVVMNDVVVVCILT